jgi:hypothetical protein
VERVLGSVPPRGRELRGAALSAGPQLLKRCDDNRVHGLAGLEGLAPQPLVQFLRKPERDRLRVHATTVTRLYGCASPTPIGPLLHLFGCG